MESNNTYHMPVDRVPHICTLLTKDYFIQGLALYSSLKRHTSRFQLWVLCVDDTVYNLLEIMNLDKVHLVRLGDLWNRQLATIKEQRQVHEFCWTLKAPFITYLLNNNDHMNSILYMDADLYFFKNVAPIYNEWGNGSIYLTKLWLGRRWTKLAGKYSAGLIGFKRDHVGVNCLKLWQNQCLNWCYDKKEHGLWGDQKYLDDWPRLFPRVKISGNIGINGGPWNIRKVKSVYHKNGVIFFDNMELVCYHFSGFEIINGNMFNHCKRKKLPQKANGVYSMYIREIKKIMERIHSMDNRLLKGFIENNFA